MRNRILKNIAATTAFCFFIHQLYPVSNGWAAPSAVAVPPVQEVQIPQSFHLKIPSDLGTIETHVSGDGPFVVHIQTAHGNYEAQKKIQATLHYLKENYGFDLLLMEGASTRLNPDLIRFFPDRKDLTIAVAENMARKAYIKGPELFLLEEDDVVAYGIENKKSYLQNGEAFRAVLRQKEKTENFLQKANEQVDRLASPYLGQNLRSFLRHFEDYQSDLIPFDEWLRFLKRKAEEFLDLDLTNPVYQVDWPMLVRIFKLQEFEEKLDMSVYREERERFLQAVRGFSEDIYHQVEEILTLTLTQHQLPDPETGLLFEQMAAQLPGDFNYEAYPNVNLFIGHLILRSELKGDRLALETERFTDKILNRLAKDETEREVLALYKDHLLLQKLYRLELRPVEYEQILERKEDLHPTQLFERFEEMNQTNRVRGHQFSHPEEIAELFEKALEFYRGVKERDGWMLENLEARIQESEKQKAVVITGGFHSEPFKEFLGDRGYNYMLVTPKITSLDGREAYLAATLQDDSNVVVKGPRSPAKIRSGQARPPAENLAGTAPDTPDISGVSSAVKSTRMRASFMEQAWTTDGERLRDDNIQVSASAFAGALVEELSQREIRRIQTPRITMISHPDKSWVWVVFDADDDQELFGQPVEVTVPVVSTRMAFETVKQVLTRREEQPVYVHMPGTDGGPEIDLWKQSKGTTETPGIQHQAPQMVSARTESRQTEEDHLSSVTEFMNLPQDQLVTVIVNTPYDVSHQIVLNALRAGRKRLIVLKGPAGVFEEFKGAARHPKAIGVSREKLSEAGIAVPSSGIIDPSKWTESMRETNLEGHKADLLRLMASLDYPRDQIEELGQTVQALGDRKKVVIDDDLTVYANAHIEDLVVGDGVEVLTYGNMPVIAEDVLNRGLELRTENVPDLRLGQRTIEKWTKIFLKSKAVVMIGDPTPFREILLPIHKMKDGDYFPSVLIIPGGEQETIDALNNPALWARSESRVVLENVLTYGLASLVPVAMGLVIHFTLHRSALKRKLPENYDAINIGLPTVAATAALTILSTLMIGQWVRPAVRKLPLQSQLVQPMMNAAQMAYLLPGIRDALRILEVNNIAFDISLSERRLVSVQIVPTEPEKISPELAEQIRAILENRSEDYIGSPIGNGKIEGAELVLEPASRSESRVVLETVLTYAIAGLVPTILGFGIYYKRHQQVSKRDLPDRLESVTLGLPVIVPTVIMTVLSTLQLGQWVRPTVKKRLPFQPKALMPVITNEQRATRLPGIREVTQVLDSNDVDVGYRIVLKDRNLVTVQIVPREPEKVPSELADQVRGILDSFSEDYEGSPIGDGTVEAAELVLETAPRSEIHLGILMDQVRQIAHILAQTDGGWTDRDALGGFMAFLLFVGIFWFIIPLVGQAWDNIGHYKRDSGERGTLGEAIGATVLGIIAIILMILFVYWVMKEPDSGHGKQMEAPPVENVMLADAEQSASEPEQVEPAENLRSESRTVPEVKVTLDDALRIQVGDFSRSYPLSEGIDEVARNLEALLRWEFGLYAEKGREGMIQISVGKVLGTVKIEEVSKLQDLLQKALTERAKLIKRHKVQVATVNELARRVHFSLGSESPLEFTLARLGQKNAAAGQLAEALNEKHKVPAASYGNGAIEIVHTYDGKTPQKRMIDLSVGNIKLIATTIAEGMENKRSESRGIRHQASGRDVQAIISNRKIMARQHKVDEMLFQYLKSYQMNWEPGFLTVPRVPVWRRALHSAYQFLTQYNITRSSYDTVIKEFLASINVVVPAGGPIRALITRLVGFFRRVFFLPPREIDHSKPEAQFLLRRMQDSLAEARTLGERRRLNKGYYRYRGYLWAEKVMTDFIDLPFDSKTQSSVRKVMPRELLIQTLAGDFEDLLRWKGGVIKDQKDKDILNFLIDRLQDRDPWVVKAAIRGIGAIAEQLDEVSKQAVLDRYYRILGSRGSIVARGAAARDLREVQSPQSLPRLIQFIKSERTEWVQTYIAEAIEFLIYRYDTEAIRHEHGKNLVDVLLENAIGLEKGKRSFIMLRVASIKALGRLGWFEDRIASELERMFLNDPDSTVQEAALWALAQLYVSEPQGMAQIDSFLRVLIRYIEVDHSGRHNVLLENYAVKLLEWLSRSSSDQSLRAKAKELALARNKLSIWERAFLYGVDRLKPRFPELTNRLDATAAQFLGAFSNTESRERFQGIVTRYERGLRTRAGTERNNGDRGPTNPIVLLDVEKIVPSEEADERGTEADVVFDLLKEMMDRGWSVVIADRYREARDSTTYHNLSGAEMALRTDMLGDTLEKLATNLPVRIPSRDDVRGKPDRRLYGVLVPEDGKPIVVFTRGIEKWLIRQTLLRPPVADLSLDGYDKVTSKEHNRIMNGIERALVRSETRSQRGQYVSGGYEIPVAEGHYLLRVTYTDSIVTAELFEVQPDESGVERHSLSNQVSWTEPLISNDNLMTVAQDVADFIRNGYAQQNNVSALLSLYRIFKSRNQLVVPDATDVQIRQVRYPVEFARNENRITEVKLAEVKSKAEEDIGMVLRDLEKVHGRVHAGDRKIMKTALDNLPDLEAIEKELHALAKRPGTEESDLLKLYVEKVLQGVRAVYSAIGPQSNLGASPKGQLRLARRTLTKLIAYLDGIDIAKINHRKKVKPPLDAGALQRELAEVREDELFKSIITGRWARFARNMNASQPFTPVEAATAQKILKRYQRELARLEAEAKAEAVKAGGDRETVEHIMQLRAAAEREEGLAPRSESRAETEPVRVDLTSATPIQDMLNQLDQAGWMPSGGGGWEQDWYPEHIQKVAFLGDALLLGDSEGFQRADPETHLSLGAIGGLSEDVRRLSNLIKKIFVAGSALHDIGQYLRQPDEQAHQDLGALRAAALLTHLKEEALIVQSVAFLVNGHSDPWNLAVNVQDTRLEKPSLDAEGKRLGEWVELLLSEKLISEEDLPSFLSEMKTAFVALGVMDIHASGDRHLNDHNLHQEEGREVKLTGLRNIRKKVGSVFDPIIERYSTRGEARNKYRHQMDDANIQIDLTSATPIHNVVTQLFASGWMQEAPEGWFQPWFPDHIKAVARAGDALLRGNAQAFKDEDQSPDSQISLAAIQRLSSEVQGLSEQGKRIFVLGTAPHDVGAYKNDGRPHQVVSAERTLGLLDAMDESDLVIEGVLFLIRAHPDPWNLVTNPEGARKHNLAVDPDGKYLHQWVASLLSRGLITRNDLPWFLSEMKTMVAAISAMDVQGVQDRHLIDHTPVQMPGVQVTGLRNIQEAVDSVFNPVIEMYDDRKEMILGATIPLGKTDQVIYSMTISVEPKVLARKTDTYTIQVAPNVRPKEGFTRDNLPQNIPGSRTFRTTINDPERLKEFLVKIMEMTGHARLAPLWTTQFRNAFEPFVGWIEQQPEIVREENRAMPHPLEVTAEENRAETHPASRIQHPASVLSVPAQIVTRVYRGMIFPLHLMKLGAERFRSVVESALGKAPSMITVGDILDSMKQRIRDAVRSKPTFHQALKLSRTSASTGVIVDYRDQIPAPDDIRTLILAMVLGRVKYRMLLPVGADVKAFRNETRLLASDMGLDAQSLEEFRVEEMRRGQDFAKTTHRLVSKARADAAAVLAPVEEMLRQVRYRRGVLRIYVDGKELNQTTLAILAARLMQDLDIMEKLAQRVQYGTDLVTMERLQVLANEVEALKAILRAA